MRTQPKPVEIQHENFPLSTTAGVIAKQKLTKSQRFHKIAGRRVATALKAIELIGNCTNTTLYEFSDEDVRRVFLALHETLSDVEKRFQPKAKTRAGKNFFEEPSP